MGYIQDGFGIFGPRDEYGKVLTAGDLDEFHGHTTFLITLVVSREHP